MNIKQDAVKLYKSELDPKTVALLIGPGRIGYTVRGEEKEGLQDPFAIWSGYFFKEIYFLERPEDVTDGGLRANDSVCSIVDFLIENTGFSPSRWIYADMNSDLEGIREQISSPITLIDHRSHSFWVPSHEVDDVANYAVQQYLKLMEHGDTLVVHFPEQYGKSRFLNFTRAMDQAGMNPEGYAILERLKTPGLLAEKVRSGEISSYILTEEQILSPYVGYLIIARH